MKKITFLLLIILFLTGCRNGADLHNDGTKSAIQPESSKPAVEPTADELRASIANAWQEGPHASTYDIEKGPNTYCSKCHSPLNWDPASVVDPPPNCVSCKFSFEDEPLIAVGNPLVPEEEWVSIGCDVCHRMEADVPVAEYSWFDPVTNYYITVIDSSELCEKCHLDNEALRHRRDLGTEVHTDFSCTNCHDPHRTNASCTACHEVSLDGTSANIATAGHIPEHSTISCVACHDAAGLEVGPLEGLSVWITFRTTILLGRPRIEPYQSHNIAGKVACSRCHYPDNPWGLRVEDEVKTP